MGKRGKTKINLAKVRGYESVPLPQNDNTPTMERLAQAGVVLATRVATRKVEMIGSRADSPVGDDGVFRVCDAPLDRYHARGRLDERNPDRGTKLFEAGERLRAHWYYGTGPGIGSIDLNRAGGGNGDPVWAMPTSESAAYHRQQMRRARQVLDADTWSTVFAIVCAESTLEDAGRQAGFSGGAAAAAVALDRLRRGLAELAVLWGTLPPPRPANDDRLTLRLAASA